MNRIGLAAALFAFSAYAQAAVEERALGLSKGQDLPDGAEEFEKDGPVTIYRMPPVAGLDAVAFVHSETYGVCKVTGMVDVDADGDSYGIRHKAAADDLIAKVVAKLGREPSDKVDFNADALFDEPEDWLSALRRGNAQYLAAWQDDAASPFSTVAVETRYGFAMVHFFFSNSIDCFAERDAAEAAEF